MPLPANKYTKRRVDQFIESYTLTNNITASCRSAGISRGSYVKWRVLHPEFDMRCQEAEESALDYLEQKAFELANNPDPGMIKWLLAHGRKAKYGAESTLHIDNRLSDDEINEAILKNFPDESELETASKEVEPSTDS